MPIMSNCGEDSIANSYKLYLQSQLIPTPYCLTGSSTVNRLWYVIYTTFYIEGILLD